MDKTTAQRIVRDTLKAPFDKKRYRDFTNELCNGFDESKAQSMGVPDAFAQHVKSCQRLGTYNSPDGELADILIVNITDTNKLERTRTALRDFVAHKLKRDESYKEAGLVAFVSPDSQSWRFSYVRMEYGTKRDPKTGKIKPEERLTPARRYSYLVGVDEECHTAQTRFLDLLQNTSDHPTLSQIQEAFSVETVTKEFFNEYSRLFATTNEQLESILRKNSSLRADFKEKGVSSVDFSKKLLGQIVFLYFIQKKGWLGVSKAGNWGEGPRNFLRHIANQAVSEKKCLFNDVLEPLFYETLATDRGQESWCSTFKCRIPFLNGGLFEPIAGYDWKNTEINFPNTLFTNTALTEAGDTGTGILDVFDRYNFTVNESEPLEQEVAIDPEMLGKVFENLIEENRRKGLGAFYTPRQIVHYMCQESLINFIYNTICKSASTGISRQDIECLILEGEQASHYEVARKEGVKSYGRKLPATIEINAQIIDDILHNLTVCDPAIGSGAFPVGMMTEIVRARCALTPYIVPNDGRTPYQFKRHAIQNTIYGVDIDNGAVEIAKLRLWLSLVVDEENNDQIKPLPNLDFKVVTGNSLLGVERNLFNNSLFGELEHLKPKFFNETNIKLKVKYRSQIDNIIHQLTNGREVFDYEIYFSEVISAKNGFDIIIGNPPYNELRDLSEAEQLAYKKSPHFEHASGGRINLFQFFYPLALCIANKSAVVCLITQNSILAEDSAIRNRKILIDKSRILRFISFPERDDVNRRVFESAKMSVCIGIFETRTRSTPDYEFEVDVWYDRFFSEGHTLRLKLSEIRTFWPDKLIIPLSSEPAFKLLRKIKLKQDVFYVEAKSGEIDMTKYKPMFNTTCKGKRVLTGAQVQRYRITDTPQQGSVIYLDNKKIPISKDKAADISSSRIVMQRITGVDSCTRLIMTIAPEDVLCANSTNYIPNGAYSDMNYLLGVFNSALVNFYLKQTSTNTNITTSEICQIPIAKPTEEIRATISDHVLKILKAKQKNPNQDTTILEAEIDKAVFKAYDISSAEQFIMLSDINRRK
jgi:Alw26I/Eco31I/Esp3I family type II restriction m6 adenine DNA methyltransferase